jgi:GDPmannose 4,6-dehydratase
MKVLITGIAGQDGSYLAEYLLSLGYQVFGIVRQKSSLRNLDKVRDKVTLLYGDMRDEVSIQTAILKAQPDEIYNLAGQVFVPLSWLSPNETMDINCGGLIRICKAVEDINTKIKIYHASTSEMFGNHNALLNEESKMIPGSPYGISKLAAHHAARIYRDKGLFICSGILFNHESPRRGLEMVTRKISRHVASWAVEKNYTMLRLGENTKRDWGFAGDYVKAMHLMLQQKQPDDYVIGTGKSYSIENFLIEAVTAAGLKYSDYELSVKWGESTRVNEVRDLRADCSKAQSRFGWKSEIEFTELVNMMVHQDMEDLSSCLALSQCAK